MINHVGLLVPEVASAGVKLDRPVVARPDGSKLAFTHDPWGTSIELNERPNPL